MNRRSFIAGVGAAVGAAVLDPERALWVPGARVFSLPAPIVVDHVLSYDQTRHIIFVRFIARRGDGLPVVGLFEVPPMLLHPTEPRREVARIQLARMLDTSPARVVIPEPRWSWDRKSRAPAVVPAWGRVRGA